MKALGLGLFIVLGLGLGLFIVGSNQEPLDVPVEDSRAFSGIGSVVDEFYSPSTTAELDEAGSGTNVEEVEGEISSPEEIGSRSNNEPIRIQNTTSGSVGGVSYVHDARFGSAHAWLSEHALDLYPDGVARQDKSTVAGHEALFVYGGDGSVVAAISRGDSVLIFTSQSESELASVLDLLVLE